MNRNRFFAPALKNLNLKTESLPEIEISSCFQIPAIHIIGLANAEIKEAKERVRSAISESGFEPPKRKMIINLTPAHTPKSGTGWDLGIALGILNHTPTASASALTLGSDLKQGKKIMAWGELGLNGSISSSGKTFQALLSALNSKMDVLILSLEDRIAIEKLILWGWVEPKLLQSLKVYFVGHLKEAVSTLKSLPCSEMLKTTVPSTLSKANRATTVKGLNPQNLLPLTPWFYDIIGIALSGRHSLLLLGAKGSGKSTLLRWIQQLQPNTSQTNRHEIIIRTEIRDPFFIHKITETDPIEKPCRKISSLIRPAALIGRWQRNQWIPGELALSHGGLLVADEFLEWARDSREILRSPMETGEVHIQRGLISESYQSDFQFLGSANLCPCGEWTPFNTAKCRCPSYKRTEYQHRLSGPILDRLGIVQILDPQSQNFRSETHPESEPLTEPVSEKFKFLKNRISEVHLILKNKYGDLPGKLKDSDLHDIVKGEKGYINLNKEYPNASYRFYHQRARVALTLNAWSGSNHTHPIKLTELDFQMACRFFTSPWEL